MKTREQYNRLKGEKPGFLLFLREGDEHYEAYFEDALNLTSNYAGLDLGERNEDGDTIQFVQFHKSQLDKLIACLIRAGYRVAICERVSE